MVLSWLLLIYTHAIIVYITYKAATTEDVIVYHIAVDVTELYACYTRIHIP